MLILSRLSIQSKLILLLLLVSLGSMIPMALIGYRSGRDALEERVTNQLTSLREGKAEQVRTRFKFIRDQVITLGEDRMFVEAMKEFKAGFAKLHSAKLTPEQQGKLREFYEKDFLPALEKNSEGKPSLDTYYPRSPTSSYLQYHYIANNPEPYGDKDGNDDFADTSDYATSHKKYHPLIRNVANRFAYRDILLIDLESEDVVYSSRKNTVLAANLRAGSPYASSNLADLVKLMRKVKDGNTCQFIHYENYTPELNKPAAFVGSPLLDEGQVIGLLAFQFSIDELSKVLRGDMAWEKDGLGKTGEVYLVGTDGRMRSEARFFLEERNKYLEMMRRTNYPRKQIDDVKNLETTILTQDARIEAITRTLAANAGKGATEKVVDYRGTQVLASFAPLEVETYQWIIIAKQDLDEAFSPISEFGRLVAVTAGVTTLVVSLLAVMLSAFLVRPIHQLIDGARQVSKGSLNVSVNVSSRDEFRELADSFNEMTSSLKVKSDLAEHKTQEHERLLLHVMPASAVERFKGGQQVSDQVADVTVLVAEIGDFLELTRDHSPERAISLFNDLVVAFDEAAARLGVEKVKTVGSSYLAVCGLTVQRLDHPQRTVEYATEMLRIVRHFNQERGTHLTVQIGIHAGPVVGGVVGSTRFLYDLWGDTVNIARAVQSHDDLDAIRVTEAVHGRLGSQHTFIGPEMVEIPGEGTIRVWAIAIAMPALVSSLS